MTTQTVTPERVRLAQDFGERFCQALAEYDIVHEIECTVFVAPLTEAVYVRLERETEEGVAIYLIEHVLYGGIEEVGDRAFKAIDLANKLLSALLLKEGP